MNTAQANRPRLDLPGVATGTLGLFPLVYGFSNSERQSWGSPLTIVMLGAGAALLALFVAVESRAAHPLLPLRVLTATSVNGSLLRRTGPRPLLTLGMLLGAVAMVWLAQLTPSSSYSGHVLPALLVLGVGLGNIFAPAIASATYGVEPQDTGVASAMVYTMQQVGGSIGTALLSSIFAGAASTSPGLSCPSPPRNRLRREPRRSNYGVASHPWAVRPRRTRRGP